MTDVGPAATLALDRMISPSRGQSEWIRFTCLVLLALMVGGYQAVASVFYQGFRVSQGGAMNHLPLDELAHYMMFLTFGGAAAALVYGALRGLPLCDRLGAGLSSFCARPLAPALAAAAFVLASCLYLSHGVLGGAVTTDDEHAYRFIAQTLRQGAWVAPSPGGDLEFFQEQFVVLNERVRYGKYPVGHPLLLALGQAAGAEALMVPLVTALIVFPLRRLAERLAGRRVAGATCLLYAASPEVWFVGATYLSQPLSALALVAGLALLVAPRAEEAPGRLACALAGLSLGYGVLVRPLPGVLFVAVAGLDLLLFPSLPLAQRVRRAVAFGVPVAALASVLLLTNQAQTGAAAVSGYEQFHSPGQGLAPMIGGDAALLTMSFVSAVVRTNFWLFGWPLSLAPCLLAGRIARGRLVWGVLAALVAYRFLSPKAGVGGTGALYVFEGIPVLCLLAALGLARLARGEVFAGRAGAIRRDLAPAMVALSSVAVALFVPPKLADLRRMGDAQLAVHRQIVGRGLHSALVFHRGVAPLWALSTWAYFPRCNGPRLDDDVLFIRFQHEGGVARNLDFWRRRYPERSAWFFEWKPQSGPALIELSAYVASLGGPAVAAAAEPASAPYP